MKKDENGQNFKKDIISRLRLVVGGVLAVGGTVVIVIGGTTSGWNDLRIWLIGLGLILAAVLISGSARLISEVIATFR